MIARRRPVVAVAIVVCVAVGARVAFGETRDAHHAAVLPWCANAGRELQLPRALNRFPLPEGSVVDSRGKTYGYTLLTGRVPGYINPVRNYFVSQLPANGWKLGAGDAEGVEAESFFSGHGIVGHFKVHALANCAGALSLRITFRRQ